MYGATMMNKNALLLLALGLVVTGCAGSNNAGEHAEPLACIEPEPIKGPCNGNPNDPKVNLNLQTMKANPPNVCASPGSTIEINISPKPEFPGTVSVVAKDPTNTWLNGTNAPDSKTILIYVPAWTSLNTDNDYGFTTSLGTCVDPRVQIIRR